MSDFTSEGLNYLLEAGFVKRPLTLGPDRTVGKSGYHITEDGLLALFEYATSSEFPLILSERSGSR